MSYIFTPAPNIYDDNQAICCRDGHIGVNNSFASWVMNEIMIQVTTDESLITPFQMMSFEDDNSGITAMGSYEDAKEITELLKDACRPSPYLSSAIEFFNFCYKNKHNFYIG